MKDAMAWPDAVSRAAIPAATIARTPSTTLALRTVKRGAGQVTCFSSAIDSRKKPNLLGGLIDIGLLGSPEDRPAQSVVGGAGGLGGRGGVRAPTRSGSTSTSFALNPGMAPSHGAEPVAVVVSEACHPLSSELRICRKSGFAIWLLKAAKPPVFDFEKFE